MYFMALCVSSHPSRCLVFSLLPESDSWSVLFFQMPQARSDYYLVTSRSGNHPNAWSREIKRHSKPMGIRLTASGFKSEMAAQFAGKKLLADFLAGLAEEERRLK